MKHQECPSFFVYVSSVHFHAGLQLRRNSSMGKELRSSCSKDESLNIPRMSERNNDLPQGTPRGSERGEQLKLPHSEPGAFSSLILKRLT